ETVVKCTTDPSYCSKDAQNSSFDVQVLDVPCSIFLFPIVPSKDVPSFIEGNSAALYQAFDFEAMCQGGPDSLGAEAQFNIHVYGGPGAYEYVGAMSGVSQPNASCHPIGDTRCVGGATGSAVKGGLEYKIRFTGDPDGLWPLPVANVSFLLP
ncbi:MAG: hypothetical protein WCW31_04510, partial [Patescibacteria group bacterium]